jgi:hypothetical protein
MSETFFSRWSRRKRAASIPAPSGGEGGDPGLDRGEPGGGDPSPTDLVKAPPTPDPSPPFAARTGGGEPHGPSSLQTPAFDPASLPPIESIDAGTDVTAFLQPGVPANLTQAALRRAWVADPAIRDFVGPAENAWDFNAPGGVPGFEPLRAIDDVRRLAAQIGGVLLPAPPEPAASTQAKNIADVPQAGTQPAPAPGSPPEAERPVGDVATQKESRPHDS